MIAGSFRRLAAAVYDGLLLLAVLMVATGVLHLFTRGEAITRASAGPWEYAYRAVLLAIVVVYFGIAWTRRGQTLGMKAWSLRVERTDGGRPTWADVVRRLGCAAPLYLLAIGGVLAFMRRLGGPGVLAACLAPLVASYAWLWLRGAGTAHDLLSRTRVVRDGTGDAR